MGYATAHSLLKEKFMATSCYLPAHMEPTNPPDKAAPASYEGIDPYNGPASSPPPFLGAANNTKCVDAASDDDGGNGSSPPPFLGAANNTKCVDAASDDDGGNG
eukprot:CAMPEP_0172329424 /NCGR_PEP_ID=MMETSP1058-20130122/60874_1 /TAXON_ID=83371 /ORGANISM="Detonula confervacea, Strain CCMP 353" /LENGTH=103 /DNA_ID=CAMNT_0013046595 /DNA_START=83 /DNA_END=395 /DNA_ORIENTATION=-